MFDANRFCKYCRSDAVDLFNRNRELRRALHRLTEAVSKSRIVVEQYNRTLVLTKEENEVSTAYRLAVQELEK